MLKGRAISKHDLGHFFVKCLSTTEWDGKPVGVWGDYKWSWTSQHLQQVKGFTCLSVTDDYFFFISTKYNEEKKTYMFVLTTSVLWKNRNAKLCSPSS